MFAVFPSVDEYGHVHGATHDRAAAALRDVDAMLAEKLDGFDGELLVSADHGLTDTHTHLDLRALVEERAGPTAAFPLIGKPNPQAVVCESGNAMAHVYLRGEGGWRERPDAERSRGLAPELLELDGIDSVAVRAEEEGLVELLTRSGEGVVRFRDGGLFQRGDAFARDFDGLDPAAALAASQSEDDPDAAFALTSLCASPRTGDLLVSASVGTDLREAREWPEHHASHGALHRAHTVVPVLSSSPLPAAPLRTLDLFRVMLDAAGIPLDEFPASDAALLARGKWEPGVSA